MIHWELLCAKTVSCYYFGVCVLRKFQQSGLEFEKFEKSDPPIASWYELALLWYGFALLRFTTSKNFVQKITVRFKLNWMQAV